MLSDLYQSLNVHALLNREFLDNSWLSWSIALGVAVLTNLVLTLIVRNIRFRVAQQADFVGSDWWVGLRDLAFATKYWFLFSLSLYCGLYGLTLRPTFRNSLHSFIVLVFLLQAGLWAGVLLRLALDRWMRTRGRHDPAGLMAMTFVGYFGRIVLWAIVLVLMLENLGIQVTALVAGLGIGGAAIALASQSILSDLFASLSIVVDQPFLLGDFIVVGDVQGTVEQIGIKTVHIRSLSGEQLIVPSHDLLQSRIRNFKRMEQRRVLFNFTVYPDTSTEKLAALPGIVREIIEQRPQVRFERAHLQSFGDFGVRYEVVFHVLSADFNVCMDEQQTIYLDLLRRLESQRMAIAYQKGLLSPDELAPPAALEPPKK